MRLESGDRVLVTGATGFIGSAVTRNLLARGQEVVALVEPQADTANLDGLDVKQVVGDLRSAEDVRQVVQGCRAVFHVAALYRFWARGPLGLPMPSTSTARATCSVPPARPAWSVSSTRARSARSGSSTSPTAAPPPTSVRSPTCATSTARTSDRSTSPNTRCCAPSRRACRHPSSCRPSPSARGTAPRRRPASSCSTTSTAACRVSSTPSSTWPTSRTSPRVRCSPSSRAATVAATSWAARNLDALEQLLGRLAAITGLPRARLKVPRALSLAVAAVSETIEGRILHRHPSIPLEAARMSTSQMAFDVSRARAELGYSPRPADEALEASARWFAVDTGIGERAAGGAAITWPTQLPG